jgi:ABC-type multidrug transport system ATPase subunit
MKISLNDIGKRFQRHWIFRNINYEFALPGAYALLGPNGSGKSTLLRVVAGMQSASTGKVNYTQNGQDIELNSVFPHITFCAPGQEIVEELTFREFLEFHFSFKKPLSGLSIDNIITETGLQAAADKQIGDYSSGMKQRVKLAQAIFTDSKILLLDEPCSNLDQQGVEQYRDWMDKYSKDRLVLVASNDVREYYFCREQLVLEDFK